MAIISKDSLPDAASTLPRETVSLKEWGIDGDVYVRALTSAEERKAMQYANAQDAELNAYICSVACVDDDNKPVFSLQWAHSAAGSMCRHVAGVSMKLSGMVEQDEGDEGKS